MSGQRISDPMRISTGKIISYSDKAGGGVVEAGNGRTYYFSKAEWKSPETKPQAGIPVIFKKDRKHACDVRLDQAPALKISG
jgi:hypothetical protein